MESFPDLGEDELSCEERGGLLWVLWCCVEGVWDKEGMSVGLVEIALKGSDI